jgi:hypothetical protein
MGAGLSREEREELTAARKQVKELQVQLDAGGRPYTPADREELTQADREELAAYRQNYGTPYPARGTLIITNDFVLQSDGSKDISTPHGTSISCKLSRNSCGPNTTLTDNMCVVDS